MWGLASPTPTALGRPKIRAGRFAEDLEHFAARSRVLLATYVEIVVTALMLLLRFPKDGRKYDEELARFSQSCPDD